MIQAIQMIQSIRRYDVLRLVSATIGATVRAVKGSHTNGVSARGHANGGMKWRELTQVSARAARLIPWGPTL